jgi:alpha-beta hydrolase superfamily lysophospholipase
MSAWRSVPVALVVALAGAAAAAGCVDESDEPPLGVADPAFYETADPLPPGKPGDVLRVEEVEGLGGEGRLLRVLYRSESLVGDGVPVSGVIAVPPGQPPEGGWPVLSLAHGSVGIADGCAPSRAPSAQAAEVAARGVVVVATDYEGLGTAGRHPYLVGESEARGVIDIVRAARSLGDLVGASSRYAVVGWSQGGQAAIFANEIAATWAPELELVGAVAGAPAVELASSIAGPPDPALEWLQVLVAVGLGAADPTADPEAVLTPSGRERLPVVDEGCADDVAEAYEDGGALSADLLTTAPFDRLLAANTPGQRVGAAPLLLVGGDADELITPTVLDAAQARLCRVGQVVDRRTYPGIGHDGIIVASIVDAVLWTFDRFAGKPAADVCP